MSVKKQHITDEEYYARLGHRIKQLRVDADFISAESFAREYNIGRTQYLAYEKGKNMTLETLLRLARVHEMTVEELIRGIE
ncbi:MAG: helix-turn-helix transcriptional regulator [Chitinophaga sp.]|uniref:helix-turn-helix transcriptional regulator n=1 Tax=Chitinophaga sp. TaxID=1869181 RepID=UPI0025B9BDED|nr:helix-turn-helix transcriptional regulator [Chitinophaga sp.]MBV8252252.1 helix-turn-helix transcriptional regulator [Chitinophaga sp.]